MTTLIIDATPGNLHSAEKAFQRMAPEVGAGPIVVGSDPDAVAAAERLVLPGDGPSLPAWQRSPTGPILLEAIEEAVVRRAVPFLGICVGMQLLATTGEEFGETAGLGWVPGRVTRIVPEDPRLKVPHMGWNDLRLDRAPPGPRGRGDGRPCLFRPLLPVRGGRPRARAGPCRLRRAGHRHRRARQHRRHSVSPREVAVHGAEDDRELSRLASLELFGAARFAPLCPRAALEKSRRENEGTAMILYPAIDLKDGQCVRLLRGEMEAATVFGDDPAAQARAFEAAGAEWLHLVDLNGAFAGRPVNADAVAAILDAVSLPVQLAGASATWAPSSAGSERASPG